jgi:hypothetical protein
MVKHFFCHAFAALIFSGLPSHILVAAAEGSPTILQCVLNATASRGYGFDEKQWLGILTGGGLLILHSKFPLLANPAPNPILP